MHHADAAIGRETHGWRWPAGRGPGRLRLVCAGAGSSSGSDSGRIGRYAWVRYAPGVFRRLVSRVWA
jgi:hypothetical protein